MSDAAARRLVTILAGFLVLGVVGASLALVLAAAGYTFAFDYLAYDAAARRLLAGEPVFDLSFESTGTFGLFYYPPTFLFLVLPFALLPTTVAAWAWIVASVLVTIAAVAFLPVRREVRAIVGVLVGLSWPFLFAVKVGAVGPILLLAFAVGWRLLERDVPLAGSIAFGAAVKLQPALLLGWLALVGRWRALAWGLGLVGIAGVAATLVVGPSAWADLATLYLRVTDAITNPQNFAPATTALYLGAPIELARAVQVAWLVVVGGLVLASTRWATREASYIVAAVATQISSPILWDHYAIVLALPVAWLLQRRQWWAVVIPLSQLPALIGVVPPLGWLAGYLAALAAVVVLAVRERTSQRAGIDVGRAVLA